MHNAGPQGRLPRVCNGKGPCKRHRQQGIPGYWVPHREIQARKQRGGARVRYIGRLAVLHKNRSR